MQPTAPFSRHHEAHAHHLTIPLHSNTPNRTQRTHTASLGEKANVSSFGFDVVACWPKVKFDIFVTLTCELHLFLFGRPFAFGYRSSHYNKNPNQTKTLANQLSSAGFPAFSPSVRLQTFCFPPWVHLGKLDSTNVRRFPCSCLSLFWKWKARASVLPQGLCFSTCNHLFPYRFDN